MCHILPYVWLDEVGCVEPLSLVSSVHVPGDRIFFESIPEGKQVCMSEATSHTFNF